MALVEVTPTEYREKTYNRYYSCKIDTFTVEVIYEYIKTKNFKIVPKIWQEDDAVYYLYSDDNPLIIIKDGKLFTTEDTWNDKRFTANNRRRIRQEASIVMRILRSAKIAQFKRGKATFKSSCIPNKYKSYGSRHYHSMHPKDGKTETIE